MREWTRQRGAEIERICTPERGREWLRTGARDRGRERENRCVRKGRNFLYHIYVTSQDDIDQEDRPTVTHRTQNKKHITTQKCKH